MCTILERWYDYPEKRGQVLQSHNFRIECWIARPDTFLWTPSCDTFLWIETDLQQRKLPAVILERHQQTVKQYQTELATLLNASLGVCKSRGQVLQYYICMIARPDPIPLCNTTFV